MHKFCYLTVNSRPFLKENNRICVDTNRMNVLVRLLTLFIFHSSAVNFIRRLAFTDNALTPNSTYHHLSALALTLLQQLLVLCATTTSSLIVKLHFVQSRH